MLEILQFVFESGWHFGGSLVLIITLSGAIAWPIHVWRN